VATNKICTVIIYLAKLVKKYPKFMFNLYPKRLSASVHLIVGTLECRTDTVSIGRATDFAIIIADAVVGAGPCECRTRIGKQEDRHAESI